MKAHGVSALYKAMVTEHNIGWTLSDLFTELVREYVRLCTNDRARCSNDFDIDQIATRSVLCFHRVGDKSYSLIAGTHLG